MRQVLLLSALAAAGTLAAQTPVKRAEPATAPSPASVAQLAESGHCREALPLLRAAMEHAADTEQKKRLGMDGVHCAVSLNDADSADDFVRALKKRFPHDPDVLYLAVHVFSDLSLRASEELSATAPASYQMHELNGEALEAQGRQDEAAAEYREVLKKEPNLRGIHYRIGRLLLSGPNRDTARDEARREFEAELKIDPGSGAVEYVLGELARQDQQTPAAVEHFRRATKLDPGFTDAFIGLGRALLEGGRSDEALAPLQVATKLQPDNPAAHFYLATAYQRSGHQEDASREFARQQQANDKVKRTHQEMQAVATGSQKAVEPKKTEP